MEFLEKDLEDIIYDSFILDEGEELRKRGLGIQKGRMKRQLRIGNYGIADLICIRREPGIKWIDIEIIELKKGIVGFDTLDQSLRYFKGIERYFESRGVDCEINTSISLIGSEVTSNLIYLPDFFTQGGGGGAFDISIYTYEYKIDGLKFNQVLDWHLIEEGF